MISPTGSTEIRGSDKHGSGAFKSSRGWRPHYGVDPIIKIIGQEIYAPIDGLINREIRCYPDTTKYRGLEIIGEDTIQQVLYIFPVPDIVGKEVKQGDVIGFAQKISDRYKGITESIHWQIWANPILYL